MSRMSKISLASIVRFCDRLLRTDEFSDWEGAVNGLQMENRGTVKRIADRVAVMLKGRLIAEGPLAKIFAPPYHPYTELLLSSVPEMDTHWLDHLLARRAKTGPWRSEMQESKAEPGLS